MCRTHVDTTGIVWAMQQEKGIRRVTLSSVGCLALQHFSTLSQKGHEFRGGGGGEGGMLLNVRCVFGFLNNFVWNVSYSE